MGMWLFKRRKKKVGLALGGGGPKGLAHIGAIKVLVENNISIDMIAGCSAGALIGGIYALKKDIYEVEKLARSLTYKEFFNIFFDPYLRGGIIKGDGIVKFLEKQIGRVNIEELAIPFRAVAADYMSGKTFVFDRGDLAQAIRASGSVPFYFEPIYVEDSNLIDGSASMPVPVQIVRDMGADVVIAINLDGFYTTSLKSRKSMSPFFPQMIGVTLDLLRYHLSYECAKKADIVVTPELPLNESWKKFIHGDDIILKGEQAMKDELSLLKKKLR